MIGFEIMRIQLFILSFFIFIIGCQTTAPLTPQQRRALQVCTFSSASYNTVFQAFKTVMQDEGYIIKNQDFSGGLIVAESQKPVSVSGGQFAMAVAVGVLSGMSGNSSTQNNYKTGQVFSWSVNLEEIQKDSVEARLILQKLDFYSQGGKRGREILDPEIYRNIFVKVLREIERRKALKRK